MLKRHGMVRLTFLFNNDNKITEIPIIRIRPNKAQPRKQFDEASLTSLSQSITENGILQPLTVRRASQSEYELIAGERRLRASVMAGLKKVPCIIVKCSDKESAIFALLENLQRSDLGVFEEARGISRLIRRFGLTQEEAAQRLGKTQSTIANKLRLLEAYIRRTGAYYFGRSYGAPCQGITPNRRRGQKARSPKQGNSS